MRSAYFFRVPHKFDAFDADDLWSHDHLACLLNAAENSTALKQHGIAASSNLRLRSRAGRPSIDRKVAAQKIDDYFHSRCATAATR